MTGSEAMWRVKVAGLHPAGKGFFGNTKDDIASHFRNKYPAKQRSYEFNLNPFKPGSSGTYRDLWRGLRSYGSMRYSMRLKPVLERERYEEASRNVQRRMEKMRGSLGGWGDADMATASGRYRASPDWLTQSPALSRRAVPNVLGIDQDKLHGGINMLGKALGLGELAPSSRSLMPRLFPAGGSVPQRDLHRMGLQGYVQAVARRPIPTEL
jgi:hypothetical protein